MTSAAEPLTSLSVSLVTWFNYLKERESRRGKKRILLKIISYNTEQNNLKKKLYEIFTVSFHF